MSGWKNGGMKMSEKIKTIEFEIPRELINRKVKLSNWGAPNTFLEHYLGSVEGHYEVGEDSFRCEVKDIYLEEQPEYEGIEILLAANRRFVLQKEEGEESWTFKCQK